MDARSTGRSGGEGAKGKGGGASEGDGVAADGLADVATTAAMAASAIGVDDDGDVGGVSEEGCGEMGWSGGSAGRGDCGSRGARGEEEEEPKVAADTAAAAGCGEGEGKCVEAAPVCHLNDVVEGEGGFFVIDVSKMELFEKDKGGKDDGGGGCGVEESVVPAADEGKSVAACRVEGQEGAGQVVSQEESRLEVCHSMAAVASDACDAGANGDEDNDAMINNSPEQWREEGPAGSDVENDNDGDADDAEEGIEGYSGESNSATLVAAMNALSNSQDQGKMYAEEV